MISATQQEVTASARFCIDLFQAAASHTEACHLETEPIRLKLCTSNAMVSELELKNKELMARSAKKSLLEK